MSTTTTNPDVYGEALKSELFEVTKRAASLINQIAALDTTVASTGLRDQYSIPSIDRVIRTVAELWEISPARMLMRTKLRPSAEARFAAIGLSIYMLRLPRSTVGMMISGVKVADVNHCFHRNRELIETDPIYALKYRAAEETLCKAFRMVPVNAVEFPHTSFRILPRK